MLRYPVTLTKDSGSLTVTFPDFPEAFTYGDDKEEALARAVDALMTIIDGYMKDRQAIPNPSKVRRSGYGVNVPALMVAKIGLYTAMRTQRIGKAELARRLQWHLPQVDRVLDVRHASRLDQLEQAVAAVNRRLSVTVEARS